MLNTKIKKIESHEDLIELLLDTELQSDTILSIGRKNNSYIITITDDNITKLFMFTMTGKYLEEFNFKLSQAHKLEEEIPLISFLKFILKKADFSKNKKIEKKDDIYKDEDNDGLDEDDFDGPSFSPYG